MSVVLVTDGDQRSSLAVARSLGRRGHTVQVTSPSGRSLAGASRFVASDRPVGPSDASDYGRRVVAASHRVGADHVVPTTEASIRALIPLEAELPGTGIPMLNGAAFERVSDKRVVLDAARDIGISTPRQTVLESPGDLGAIVDLDAGATRSALEFPLFVKPSRSVAPPDGAGVSRSNPRARRVRSARELETLVRSTSRDAFPLLVQEEIVGTGAGVFLLVDEHDLLAAFAHRRVREKPPSGGVSVCRETASPDRTLIEMSQRLLARLGWTGPAMVEYRIDARGGQPFLMEVNGRFWGSLQLAIDAGVDFPAKLIDHAEGRSLSASPAAWRDVRLRWIWGEVDHIWASFRGGRSGSGRGWAVRDGIAAVFEVLAISRRDRFEVLRFSDPAPFLRESVGRVVGGLRRIARSSRDAPALPRPHAVAPDERSRP